MEENIQPCHANISVEVLILAPLSLNALSIRFNDCRLWLILIILAPYFMQLHEIYFDMQVLCQGPIPLSFISLYDTSSTCRPLYVGALRPWPHYH